MKMYYGNTPVKKVNISHYEMNTNDATVMPSDLQAGVSCYARGQKVVGTGKSFEFATYGIITTNISDFVPTIINVIEIASLDYPIKNLIALIDMKNIDFSVKQTIGIVTVDNIEYPITISIENSILTLNCDKTIALQVFLGKDNYI